MTDPTTTGRFYITTAIDYPNSVPHMGHAYEKVVADFYARQARLRGLETHFLIGLDEHGQKIQEAARAEGKSPQDFVDEKAEVFRELYRLLEISNDDFIRTSEPRHRRFAVEMYKRLRDAGDVYKGVYQADYCISCERALTRSELVDGKCPIHNRPTTPIEEESYFFRLSKYRDPVREHIERHPEFVWPEERRNEILARLREEVHDLSISRSTFDWGIPLPDDPRHVLYVWVDALSNYISALFEPENIYEKFWPADCHVIGKDILWFHTVIWPAMLLSAGFPLPRQVYVHGFILDKDGLKMAKHLGNVVDPLDVIREYSVDVLRFYFLRAFSSGQDGKFSLEELEERYHTELGNDLGNLLMRIAKLARTRCGGTLRPGGDPPPLDTAKVAEEYFAAADRREHHRAVESLWGLIRAINAYLNEKAPWKVSGEREVERILYGAAEAFRIAVHLLEPVMPEVARRAAETMGFALGPIDAVQAGELSYRVKEAPALFPRRERGGAGAGGQAPAGAADPFAKLEIRAGRIEEVREHPDAESLYVLTVDLGGEKRTICAGLRGHAPPAALEGRTVAVVANLKPAVLRGIESRGMILAAEAPDGKVVPAVAEGAKPGELFRVEGIEPKPKAKLSKRDFEKAPLEVREGRVTYGGKPLRTESGVELRAEAPDGSTVR